MIAGLPAAHEECHYRCFLPDLAEFVILHCADPAIKPKSYIWRRGRDSNSRYLRTHAFQACTLSHSVTSPSIGCPDENVKHYVYCRGPFGNEKLEFSEKNLNTIQLTYGYCCFLLARKKSRKIWAHSSSKIPAVILSVWLSRLSEPIVYNESTAPVLRSFAP